MKNRPRNSMLYIAVVALAVLMLAACSTTSRLADGEILYTGVKKIDIKTPDSVKMPAGLSSDVKNAVNVKPNNCLYSPYYRYPFPIGLWVWNHWDEPQKGIGKWIYNLLVQQPVLMSDVRPDIRTKIIDQVLQENGFFQGSASYQLVQGKNKKKAKIVYNVQTGAPYMIDSVGLLPDTCYLNHLIDSVAARSQYLKAGSRFALDSLSVVRVNIANAVRNKGYYFFQPDYIQYLADSLMNQGHIALRMDIADNVPKFGLKQFKTGKIVTNIYRNDQKCEWVDTFETSRGTVIQQMPSRLRENLIPSCIAFRQGRTFSVRQMNNTQTYLSRLGIFNSIEINPRPDTLAAEPTLDVYINCTFDKPLEATLEANATSKSNSYLGPGLAATVTNKNLFGGGEQFSIKINGNYEWQTGHGNSNGKFNSYEVGLTASLAFPRLLAPAWVTRRRRVLNWTRITLNAELLNRPHYFKISQFNAGFTYDWQFSRHVSNSFTPFKISYTKLLRTTHEFDSIMNANPAVALSFRDQYIPQMQYTYTYDRKYRKWSTLNFQLSLQEAGNVFWGIYELCGKRGEKNLFGTPFSQFVKGTAQIVFGQRLSRKDIWLVSRALVGAAHAYGNSTEVPYSEQFYIGGANSIRAFTVRSLGPGSYRPPKDLVNGYFDQTGTFKFELNTELRFPILGSLHGAAFIDCGNIWLLKKDPQRPGGELKASTFFKELALGTGVGLRYDLDILIIRGDLGIGIHAPYQTDKHGYYNMPSFGKSLAFHLAIGYPF